MTYIIWFFLFMAMVTFIGHGIWTAMASLFGADKEDTTTRPFNDDDQAAMRRQLKKMLHRRQIDQATYHKMIVAMTSSPLPPGVAPKVPPVEVSPWREVSSVAPTQVVQTPKVPPVVTADVISIPAPSQSKPPPLSEPPPPAQPFTDVFASFMEQKNIRWGELIGGILIIFCSTALVINFWSAISEIPTLKFFIFTVMTAAIFGVGLYTEHQWKLPMTSRGLLMIASLLVPLNFLAIAAFSQGQEANNLMVLIGEFVATVVFGVLLLWAGRVITPIWPRVFAVGLVATSATQLLIRRFSESDMSITTVTVLSMLPLICYGAVSIILLVRAWQWSRISRHRANSLLIILGVMSFAALLGMGLLAYLSGSAFTLLKRVSPVVCLYGLPALGCGMTMWRGVKSKHLAALRAVGTGCAVLGALLMLAGVILAWPTTDILVTVLVICFVVLTLMAVLYRMPAMTRNVICGGSST